MTIATQVFSRDLLQLDAAAEVDRICDWMRETVAVDFKLVADELPGR